MSCPSMITACAMRITRNNSAGVPLATTVAKSRLLMAAFTNLTLAPDVEAGEEIAIKNACGAVCVSRKLPDSLKGFNLTLRFCGWSTLAAEMLVGASVLLNGSTVRGQVWPSSITDTTQSTQIELWAVNNAPTGASDAYIHFVLPKTYNWQLSGNLDFTNGAVQLELSGYAEKNPNWTPSIAAEFEAGDTAAIQAGGPFAWVTAAALPTTINDCAYVPNT